MASTSTVAWKAWWLGNAAYRRFIPLSSSSVVNLAGFYAAENLTQMRAIVSYDFNRVCFLEGHTSPGDGGGGTYYWDQLGNDADDPMMVIRPNDFGGSGVWKQLI